MSKPRSKFKREKFDVGINMKEAHIWLLDKQEEIARAKRSGDLGKAELLGSELITSVQAQCIAVQTVANNVGARSPGLSKSKFNTNSDYRDMMEILGKYVGKPETYKATPLDRIYIPKKDGRPRPISIPSYTDRCLQALYKLALEPIAEEIADLSSYGFRPVRSTTWVAGRVLNLLANPLAKYSHVLEVDIAGCYDNIDHSFLMQIIPVVPRHVLWEWLKCGYIERDNKQAFETTRGVPQGGILSPILANLTLDGIEGHIRQRILESPNKSKGTGFCRYADDMVCFFTDLKNAETGLDAIKEFLAIRGLEVKLAKTRITNLDDDSFIFVGYEFSRIFRHNRKRKVASITIPLAAIRKFRSLVRQIYKSNKMLHVYIEEVNAVCRGWAGYYRFAHNSIYVYRSLRYWLWKQFYKKAYRIIKQRNDKANHTEIHETVMARHFGKVGSYQTWPQVFDDRGKMHQLFDPSSIKFLAPTYTNSAKNPYILEDREILDRISLKHKNSFTVKVFENWFGCCGLCRKRLDLNPIPYEMHHILPRRFGGKTSPGNLVPLCREPCHKKVSSAIQTANIEEINEYIRLGILEIPLDYINILVNRNK